MNMRTRKIKLLGFSLLALVIYYIVTDPDLGIIKNLPFGSEIILFANIAIGTIAIALLVDVLLDLYGQSDDQVEENLLKKARTSPEGAGLTYLGLSLKYLAVIYLAGQFVTLYG